MFDATQEDRSALAVVCFPDSFWTEHVEKDGKLVAIDHAKWGKRGYANWETSSTVSRLIKSFEDARVRNDGTLTVWHALEPHYKRWKEGQEAQTEGYALEGWAGGITKGQIAACKAIHIYSVEDLSRATDDAVQRLGMGAMKLRDNAKAFVASLNGDGAKLAKENAEMRDTIADLQRQMEEDRKSLRDFLAKQGLPEPVMPGDAAGETAAPKPDKKLKKAA
jgi:hypothetical protein